MFGLTSSIAVFLLSATTGGVGLPFGVPPTPEDPVLARALPEQCLFCLSWAGTASPNPNSTNQTEQLLAEPEVQEFLGAVSRKVHSSFSQVGNLTSLLAAGSVDSQKAAGTASPFPEMMLRSVVMHTGIIFASEVARPKTGKGGPIQIEGGIVVSVGDDAPVVKESIRLWGPIIEKMFESAATQSKKGSGRRAHDGSQTSKSGDDKLHKSSKGSESPSGPATITLKPDSVKLGGPVAITVTENYLVVGIGEGVVERTLARMKSGKAPKWWAAINEQLPIDRRSVVAYADVRSLGGLICSAMEPEQRAKTREILELLGVSNAASWIEVWGLDGNDFANKTLLTLEGEPRGVLQLVSDHPLKPADLAPVPSDATMAAAFRLDMPKAMDLLLALLAKVDPATEAGIVQAVEELKKSHGINLHRELPPFLSDTWCVYAAPGEGNCVFTGLTAVTELRDRAKSTVVYKRMTAAAGKLWGPPPADESNADWLSLVHVNFQKRDIFYLVGPYLSATYIAPACCMTEREMVFALSPQNVKAYLSHDGQHEPLYRSPPVSKLFNGGRVPAIAVYGDSRLGLRILYPALPYSSLHMNADLMVQTDGFLGALPSLPAIDRHMGPTTATLRRTKNGVEFVSRGTIPLPSAACWIGLIARQFWAADRSSITSGPLMVVPPQPAQTVAPVVPDTGYISPTPEAKPSLTSPLKPVEKKAPAKKESPPEFKKTPSTSKP